MNKIILVTGGARSGKSSFAEKLSVMLNDSYKNKNDIAYIAAGVAFDDEFKARIIHHQKSRDKKFVTYEEPINIDKKINDIYENHNVFLVDCITTWLGNIFHENFDDIETHATKIINNLIEKFDGKENSYNCFDYLNNKIKKSNLFKKQKVGNKILVIVSNELGQGLVPEDKISRLYRDIHGRINQRIAINSEAFFYSLSSIPLRVK